MLSLFRVPSLFPSVRLFASHGRDRYSANGSDQFRRELHVKDPNKKNRADRAAHKAKKLEISNKKKLEVIVQSKKDRFREMLGIKPGTAGEEMTPIKEGAYRFGVTKELAEKLAPPIRQMLNFVNASNKEVVHQRMEQWLEKFGNGPEDYGSTAVQIAILTEKIRTLSEHMRKHHKDMSSRRGLEAMHSNRRKLMWYLRRKNYKCYVELIKELNIEDMKPPLQGYGQINGI